MHRTLAATAKTVASILLVGCSSGPTIDSDAPFNADDVTFVQEMIPHHEQAVEMSTMVTGRTVSAELGELAAQISNAQEPEIALMRSLLDEWGQDQPAAMDHGSDDHGGHGGHSMPGMMSKEDMKSLETSADGMFERMWLQMMIEHHDGAITMSQTVLNKGKDPRVRELANAIIAAQRAEIDLMRSMLASR